MSGSYLTVTTIAWIHKEPAFIFSIEKTIDMIKFASVLYSDVIMAPYAMHARKPDNFNCLVCFLIVCFLTNSNVPWKLNLRNKISELQNHFQSSLSRSRGVGILTFMIHVVWRDVAQLWAIKWMNFYYFIVCTGSLSECLPWSVWKLCQQKQRNWQLKYNVRTIILPLPETPNITLLISKLKIDNHWLVIPPVALYYHQ